MEATLRLIFIWLVSVWPGYLNFGNINILSQITLYRVNREGAALCFVRLFSTNADLYSLEASSTSSVTTIKMCPKDGQIFLGEQNYAQVRTTVICPYEFFKC